MVQEIVCQVVNRVQPPKSVRISDVSLALKISPERIKRPILIVADLYQSYWQIFDEDNLKLFTTFNI